VTLIDKLPAYGPEAILADQNGMEAAFRALAASIQKSYTRGENFVIAHDVDRSFSRSYGGLSVKFLRLLELVSEVAG